MPPFHSFLNLTSEGADSHPVLMLSPETTAWCYVSCGTRGRETSSLQCGLTTQMLTFGLLVSTANPAVKQWRCYNGKALIPLTYNILSHIQGLDPDLIFFFFFLTNRTTVFLQFLAQKHFTNDVSAFLFAMSQPSHWCRLLWPCVLWDAGDESWKSLERSQEKGGQAVLLGSQMPQSVCRAQTLQECTNKARMKTLLPMQVGKVGKGH